MTPERLAELEFQAANNGHNSWTIKRMQKEGRKLDENGTMIYVTPAEMRELLSHYKRDEA